MFLGVDLGTSSVKVILMDKNGQVVKTNSQTYSPSYPYPLWSEQNPEVWFQKTLEALKIVVKGHENTIQAMSFSGQMHGLVLLDKNDQVIRPAILWNDQRSTKECDFLNHTIGQDKISAWTGNLALTGFTAPKILWLKENEAENFNKITKIMLPKDYLCYQLTGEFVSDVSDSSGTLYFDVQKRTWSEPMLKILEIEKKQLPKVYESYELIGQVKSSILNQMNLTQPLKVVIGGGDNAVGAIGTNTLQANECSISLGSSGVIFFPTDNFEVDSQNALHSFCHANGKNHLMGVILNAASAQEWWIKKIINSSYQEALTQINSVELEDNLFFLPYLMGERTPINDANARGVFFGLSAVHEQKHMTRAILEGVAFALKDTLEVAKSLGHNPKKAKILGGGSQAKIWLEIIANVLNITLEELNIYEGPAYGAAILARVGVNESSTIEEVSNRFIKTVNTIQPNVEHVELYAQKYLKYKQIYPSVKNLFKQFF